MLTVMQSERGIFFEYSKAANPIRSDLTPQVPYHLFPSSLYASGPSRVVPLDLSDRLRTEGPATGPGLCASFVRVLDFQTVTLAPAATSLVFYVIRGEGTARIGDVTAAWAEGDFFTAPGTVATTLAASIDSALYCVDDALRVVVPLGFGARHVAPHMTAYQAAHPEVRLELTALDGAVDLIALGFDVGVRLGTLEDSTLVAKRLGTERWELVASTRVRGVREPADLASQPCLPLVRHVTEGWTLTRGAERVRVRVDGRYRASDPENLLAPTLAGGGVALLPTWLTAADQKAGRHVRILPTWSGATLGVWGVYPPKKTVSPKVRTFLAFMSARIAQT